MKAFLGEVNEMRAIEEEEAFSSEGPAPIERSWNESNKTAVKLVSRPTHGGVMIATSLV